MISAAQQLASNMATNACADSQSRQIMIRWNSHSFAFAPSMKHFLQSGKFSDVILTSKEGLNIKCHRIVLSCCSPYFAKLLADLETSSPPTCCGSVVLFLGDLSHWELAALIDYMYNGEMTVTMERLPKLIKAAESLQIAGMHVSNTPEEPLSPLNGMSTDKNDLATEKFGNEVNSFGCDSALFKPKMPKYSDVKATKSNLDALNDGHTYTKCQDVYGLLSLSPPSSSLSSSSGPNEGDGVNSSDNNKDSNSRKRKNKFGSDGTLSTACNNDDLTAFLELPSESFFQPKSGSVSSIRAPTELEWASTTKMTPMHLNTGRKPMPQAGPAIAFPNVWQLTSMEKADRSERMEQAVALVRSGRARSVRDAAAMFGVPRTTLNSRLKPRKKILRFNNEAHKNFDHGHTINQSPINLAVNNAVSDMEMNP